MKINILIIYYLFGITMDSFAQGYGVEWVLSNNTSLLNFGVDTVGLSTISGGMPVFLTEANICDTFGNLRYYTNGVYIANKNGATLKNGDSLNPCQYTFDLFNSGLGIDQAAIFLPQPNNPRYDYLFHFSNDSVNNVRPGTIFYTIIDAQADSDSGAVIKKNIPFFRGAILREGGMTACKHGNGRDYWIVVGEHETNNYYKFLFTPDSIFGPFVQSIGPIYDSIHDFTYSKFSQDGSKFATGCAVGLILVMDFDRCSGEFSNPITLFHHAGSSNNQAQSGTASVEFSSSGKYIYATNTDDLTQYNLWADSGQDSIQIWNDSASDFYQMNMLQLAPNGKIYGSTFNGGLDALHVINYPDLGGDSCKFVFAGQRTLTLNSACLPNMINYNLGVLQGSPCDTIRTGVGIADVLGNNLLHVMPNPADKYIYVEMGMQGNYEFDLLNSIGQVIEKTETRQVDIFDTENLVSGIYFLKVTSKNTTNVFTQKVVIQH